MPLGLNVVKGSKCGINQLAVAITGTFLGKFLTGFFVTLQMQWFDRRTKISAIYY